MSVLKYRKDADSPWQRVWTKFPFLASQIGTESGKTVQEELNEKVGNADVIDIAHGGTGAGNAEEARENLGAASNPNLLDNPWFTVNQRGQTSYTPTSSNHYTFDRWCIENNDSNISVTKNSDGTITWKNNGTATNRQFKQIFEVPIAVGEKFIASIDVTAVSGTVRMYYALAVSPYSSFINCLITDTGIITDTGTVTASGATKFFIMLNENSSITFRAVKLEYGTVSTLANDHAPDYASELLKCQRYFYRPNVYGLAFAHSASWGEGIITIPTMRAVPSISNVRVAPINDINNPLANVNIAFDSTSGNNMLTLQAKDANFNTSLRYAFSCDFVADP